MRGKQYIVVIIKLITKSLNSGALHYLNEMKGKKSGVGVRANVCADHVFPEPGEISGPHVSFRLAKFPIKASQISY